MWERTRFAIFYAAIMTALLGSGTAARGAVVPMDLSTLAERCEHAVTGTVVEIQSNWSADHSTIITDIQIQVEEDLKGNFADKTGVLTLSELGGTVGETTIAVSNSPTFNVGERVLVFTERVADGRLIVLGRAHAKFTLTPAPGTTLDMAGQRQDDGRVAQRGTLAYTEPGRDLVAEVADLMAARGFAPSRLKAGVPSVEANGPGGPGKLGLNPTITTMQVPDVGAELPGEGQAFDAGEPIVVAQYAIGEAADKDLRAVAPGAVYSDITTFSGFGAPIGGASGTSGTRLTKLLADDIQCSTGSVPVTQFTFSVGNLNSSASVTCFPVVRFYADNGSNAPGTFLAGFNFTSSAFAAANIYLLTYVVPPAQQFNIPANGKMWIGTAYYITTGSSVTALNNMGVGLYTPVDVGSSADADFFSTSNGGSDPNAFRTNNPAGSVRTAPYSSAPARHGYEVIYGYCSASATTCDEYIGRVQVGAIDNSTTCTAGGYANYTALSTNMVIGTGYPVTVTNGNPDSLDRCGIWIDWSHNLSFADTGETITMTVGTGVGPYTATITPPAGAVVGPTRMRVRIIYNTAPVACGATTYGETEDYTINVCGTPGTPTSLSVSGIGQTSADLTWAAGTPAGSPTVTYYWAVGTGSGVTYESGYTARGTTTTPGANASGLAGGTPYYFTVKACTSCNNTCSAYPTAATFTTLAACTTPGAPSPSAPSGITPNHADFSWAAGTPAGSPTVTYYWAVGTSSGVTYESGYTDRGITTGTTALTNTLSPNTTYYLRVKACTSCDSTCSSYSSAVSFASAACVTPGTPTGNTPTGVTTSHADFSWAAGTPGGSSTVTYYWAVGTSSGVTYESGYVDRGTTTGTSAATNALTSNTGYYFRLKACTSCDSTCSGYSSAVSFTTAAGLFISNATPNHAPAGVGSAGPAGSLVTITGTLFGSSKVSTDHVAFFSYVDPNSVNQYVYNDSYIVSWTDTQITCYVPEDASSQDVAIYKNGVWSNFFAFSVDWSHWFRWKDQSVMPLTYYVNMNSEPGVTLASTQASLQTWEDVSGDYLDHSYAGTTTRTGSSHTDGFRDIAWLSTWTYGTGVIAQTSVTQSNGVITETDMEINGQNFTWSSTGEAGKMDVQNIVTHEGGHGWVGLSDMYGAADSAKTMYGLSGTGETFKRDLDAADIAGCQWMYATTYCPAWALTTDEYISRVQVGSIDNATSSTPGGYHSYTAQSTNMTIGTGYAIAVTNGASYTGDQCGVWVDWNQDGDFSDASEAITISGGPASFTGTITPPEGAAAGNTRLRARVLYTGTFGACGQSEYGEVEDYTVNVQSGAPADPGNPTVLQQNCGNTVIQRTGSPPGGVTWYWQGTSCGTNTGLGSGATFAATSSSTYYIRARNDSTLTWSAGCGSIAVTVNSVPNTPTSPLATPDTICSGQSSTLSATVGGGEIVEWFTDSCGGTPVTSPVSPTTTTTYYARAENTTTLCTSAGCATVTVTVNPLPVAPASAASDRNNFCADDGGNISLSVTGGSGTAVRWFDDSCGGNSIGTGNPLSIPSPATTTTYYGRWENSCGNSTCQSATVTVNPLPVAPTSAASDRDNFCADDSGNISLSITGGSGTTVRWFDDSCGGNSIGTGNPLSIASPTATTTYYARWENSCGNSTCQNVTVTVSPAPVAPSGAAADPTSACVGQSVQLSATGGSGGTLTWYAGSCSGTPIGTGATLVVSALPTDTTYYVRTEGTCGNSTCASVTLTITATPVAPSSAATDPTSACVGQSVQLSATGGSGGTLTWYADSCSGTPIGTGATIVVGAPSTDTTYYVRTEGACGNSSCASATLTISPAAVAPSSAAANPTSACVGQSVELTATGGTGGTLTWYAGSCGGTPVGTGSTLVVSAPPTDTTYYVRTEGTCGNSSCASATLTVSAAPTAPASAAVNRDWLCPADGGSIALSATGGSGTELRWYRDACNGTYLGTGSPYAVSAPATTTTYYAAWSSTCGESSCVAVTVNVDAAAPTFDTVPATVTVYADAGTNTASDVALGVATASDAHHGPVAPTAARSDSLPLTDPYPIGTTTITWTAADTCGTSAQDTTQSVVVLPQNQLIVDVQLEGLGIGTLTRCLKFELRDYGCNVQTFERAVTLVDGAAAGEIFAVPWGSYHCILVQDDLHSLTRRLDRDLGLDIASKQYVASFTGGSHALVGGDLYDDNLVDIVDFGVFIAQWGSTYGPLSCASGPPHADLTGDDALDIGDFNVISSNFLDFGDSPCCGARSTGSPPRQSITIRELGKLHLGYVARADLNHDGVIDMVDVQLFANGQVPEDVTPTKPLPVRIDPSQLDGPPGRQ